jgi:antitoxin component of RelBE/YafQ-DinJ toxin-antitoxin module
MATVAFKTEESFKDTLSRLAKLKGITLSALIKLYLTASVKKELSVVTENGLTMAEEIEVLIREQEGRAGKIYESSDTFFDALGI